MSKKVDVKPIKEGDTKEQIKSEEIIIPETEIEYIPATINEKTAAHVLDQMQSSLTIYYELVQRDNPRFTKNPIVHLNEIMKLLVDYEIITPLS